MPEAPVRNRYRHLAQLASFVLIVAIISWGRAVLIPLALAVLLAFLLSPAVRSLQQRGLPRIPSAILVVLVAFLVLGSILWILTVELTELGRNFRKYEAILETKVENLRASIKGTVLERFLSAGEEKPTAPPPAPNETLGGGLLTFQEAKPAQRVVVVADRPAVYWQLTAALDPILHLLGTTGLIVLLVILMLIHREELRNRLIRLAGYGRLTVTTRALDEASSRISYYLLMKSLVNGCFGIAIGVGLLIIGLPYAFLWGFLVAALRFIPSLGTWLAMLAPLALALVAFEEWWPILYVLCLFTVLELLTTNAIEPWIYGHRIGVSPIALVVALAFWTWLWGPVGLVLATPLTVCLAVLGKYFPQMEFINVLMSDRPALEANIRYYQRLLARDQDEATDVVEHYLTSHPVEEVYDELLLPAVTAARQARDRDELSDDDQRFVLGATRDILDDLPVPPAAAATSSTLPTILGYALRDESAALALEMLKQMLQGDPCHVDLAPPEMLLSELALRIEEERPLTVCVASLAPGGLALARSLLKRLRGRFPEMKIVVVRLGLSEDAEKDRKVLTTAGADLIATTLQEARAHVVQLLSLFPRPQADLAASAVQG